MTPGSFPQARPRRNRVSPGVRALVCETRLSVDQLVLPLFVHDDEREVAIAALPGQARRGIAGTVAMARQAVELGLRAVALFPALPASAKDAVGSAGAAADGLVPRCVRALKTALPQLVVITDVALDPFSSDGHDGVVVGDRVANDATLPHLCAIAVAQARAGADVVAPSDMMDGRVAAIRAALDAAGCSDVLICAYCAKYASAFYGPFRQALDSAPRYTAGPLADKATYQMDPANAREALRELALDEAEGADWILVKPGLPYLDIIHQLRAATTLPIAAYHVSGEYAALKAAAASGALDYERALLESLTALRRAGASMIFTYGALDAARLLNAD